MRRSLGLTAVVVLLVAAFALPAAAKGKKCKPYVPGAEGAGAETTILTDANTADSPASVTLSTTPGAGFTSPDPGGDMGPVSHAYHNVQVDPKAKTTALFVRIEFLPAWDHDLYLRFSNGSAAAYEADFNQAPGLGTNSGGHAEPGASQIDGFLSPDCAGYTIDVASSVGGGPDVVMTMWLE